jgi:hypothetical protein
MNCQYCRDHANPSKYGYAPLWFAWRPVKTDRGMVFMKRVHRRQEVGGSGNFAGTYPVFWYTYYECQVN